MKKAVKIILIIVVVLAVVIAGFAMYLNGVPITYSGIKAADKFRTSTQDYVEFTEDDFGENEGVEFKARKENGAFTSVGAMYTVQYTEEQYKKQLEVVNSYNYLNETLGDELDYVMPATQVEENGWLVRVLQVSDEDESYPKHFRMIGTNDEKHTIVYMCFTDLDLDYISENSGEQELKTFIEKSFGFDFE